jgi:hypothetical protein
LFLLPLSGDVIDSEQMTRRYVKPGVLMTHS